MAVAQIIRVEGMSYYYRPLERANIIESSLTSFERRLGLIILSSAGLKSYLIAVWGLQF